MVGWIMSRQAKANEYIARQMLHEYRGHTVESLTTHLNTESLKRIRKELGYE
jgi:hypothetical protein